MNKGGSMTGGKNRNASTPMTLQKKELTQVEQSLEGQRLKSEGLYQQQQKPYRRKKKPSELH